jgi:hypothetical protein
VLLFCIAALGLAGASCGNGGTVILITVAGLDSQAVELGVVATLDSGARQPFPRQSVARSLSASQQFAVLLPAGSGGAVSIEVDAYLGDCLLQRGQALVGLSGDPLLSAKVTLNSPAMCAPFDLQVQGPGTVTSRDAPALSCGPDASCMYWLDATRTYSFAVTPSAGDVHVEWIINGVTEPDCAGQLLCPLTLLATGNQVTVVVSQQCDHLLPLVPVPGLNLTANTTLRAVWGIAGQEAWAVGDSGTVARFRATPGTWDLVTFKDKVSNLQLQDTFTGVWGVGSPATLFVVGRGALPGTAYMLQGPATSTTTVPIATTVSQPLGVGQAAVSGFDLMNVWAVGTGGSALRWNNTNQKFETPTPVTGTAPTGDLTGAWVSDDPGHGLWAASDKSQLFSLASGAWTVAAPGGGSNVKLLAVTADSEAIYAVGPQSAVVRLSRASATPPPVPTARRAFSIGADANRTLSSVWAGSGHIFAVGDGGSVFCSRSSGAYWTRLPVPGLPTANFLGVYGSGKQVWVVGQSGTTGVVVEATLP